MRKTLLFLTCLGSVPALAQWQPTSNPIPVRTETTNCHLDPINAQTAWFANSRFWDPPFAVHISRTTDGGQTWQNVGPTPSSGQFRFGTLEAIDAQHAWLLAERITSGSSVVQELHYTADGGATWSIRTAPVPPLTGVTLRFFTLSQGVLLDWTARNLYYTSDGGQTWQRQSSFPALAAGQRLSILREAPGVLYATISDAYLRPLALLTSADQGFTWRTQVLPSPAVLYGKVVFRDAQHALLYGPNSLTTNFSTTADGGQTWQPSSALPFNIGTLTPIPGTSAYIAGAIFHNGYPLATKGSAITYDDGQTWQMLETNNGYLTIQFTAPDAGWHVRSAIAPAVEDLLYLGIARYQGGTLSRSTARTSSVAVEVFPNPSSSGIFTVRVPATAGRISQVRVTDALGRTVYQAPTLAADQRLHLSQHPKGLYSLEVQTEAGAFRHKLLIE